MFDLHNHMLPGLDDGAMDWQESLSMARLAVEDGIEGVVCTPHWVFGFFENGRTKILDAMKSLQEKLDNEGIALKVYPGAELRLHHDICKRIQTQDVLTLNDNGRYALIELPDEVLPQNLEHFFWELQMQNITPVISHPERNPVMIQEPLRLYRIVDMGSLIQVTSSSILGRFGNTVQKLALELLEHRLVHVIATDAHGLRMRTPRLSECYSQVAKLHGDETAYRLFYENPKRIIEGEPITQTDSIPFGDKTLRSSSWRNVFSLFRRRSR